MSGNIKLFVRKSIAKRSDLKYYPGWIWEITGENSQKVNIMPSWKDIEKAIINTIIHEMKVDMVTKRNPDRQRYQQFLVTMIEKCKELQTKVIDFTDIEDIYKECRK